MNGVIPMPPANEHVLAGRANPAGTEVHWIGDRHLVAGFHIAVHEQRTTATLVIATHRYGVDRSVPGIGHHANMGSASCGPIIVIHLDNGVRAGRKRAENRLPSRFAREFEPGHQIRFARRTTALTTVTSIFLGARPLAFWGEALICKAPAGSGTFPGSSASMQTP